MEVHSAHLPETRAGPVTVWVSAEGLRHIEFGPLPEEHHVDPPEQYPELLSQAVTELRQYFNGDRRDFDVPLDLGMVATDFQHRVYERLLALDYGKVTSYGALAQELGGQELSRAVGQAVGANPIPIVIPCHRVVGAGGRLTGFGGGLAAKIALLRLEGIDVDGNQPHSRVRPGVIPLDL